MAHRPASTPARTARRTVVQKAPKARGAANPDLGSEATDFDDIDTQLDIADVLSASGVLEASRNSRDDAGRYFD